MRARACVCVCVGGGGVSRLFLVLFSNTFLQYLLRTCFYVHVCVFACVAFIYLFAPEAGMWFAIMVFLCGRFPFGVVRGSCVVHIF